MSEQDPLALAADVHLQKVVEASAAEELKKHNYLTMLRNDKDLYRALTVIQNSTMPYEPEKMSPLFKELKKIFVSRSEFIKTTASPERVAKIRPGLLCLQELRDSEEVHVSIRFFASFVLAEDQESELKAREKQSPAIYAQAMEWAGYLKSLFLFGSPANEDYVPSTPSFTIYNDLMKVDQIFEGPPDLNTWATGSDSEKLDNKDMERNGKEYQIPNSNTSGQSTKRKKSTINGEPKLRIIAALTLHHKYNDGSCMNIEPIGNNEIARIACVSPSTASQFFNVEFNGHSAYKTLCRNVGKLINELKRLNGEFSPDELYGSEPPERGSNGRRKWSQRDDD